MSKLLSITNVTLDGVMQSPANAEEDSRGGFEHGGWAAPYQAMQQLGASMANAGPMLFGRRTYEQFYDVWPKRKDNLYTDILNKATKYVASTTLKEPLPWQNSTLLSGDAADAVAALKQEPGKDIVIMGSGVLVQSLMKRHLVDEFIVLIHPLVLGSGRRLFAEGSPYAKLQLAESRSMSNGVVVATYRDDQS